MKYMRYLVNIRLLTANIISKKTMVTLLLYKLNVMHVYLFNYVILFFNNDQVIIYPDNFLQTAASAYYTSMTNLLFLYHSVVGTTHFFYTSVW
jgi:hypothetical protein